MPFVASFVVSQDTSSGTITVTDTSDYAGYGGKSKYANRLLYLYYINNAQVPFPNQPDFSFADYPSDSITIPIDRDYSLNIVMTVDSIVLGVVTTAAITSITTNSAVSGGNVTNEGEGNVTAKGVCWNTTGTPTISDTFTDDGTGLGAFVSSIGSLTAATTYYVRAYATNEAGTSYGNEVSFTTSANPPVVLTTIAGDNYTANKGTNQNIVYVLKVENTAAVTYDYITGIEFTIKGNNISEDVNSSSGIKLWENTTPDLSGSPTPIQQFLPGGTVSRTYDATSLSITLGSLQTTYFIVSVDIAVGATTGHTLYFNPLTPPFAAPVVLTITGTPPQTNNQSDISPVITIGSAPIELSTIAGSNYTANKSTTNNIVYVLSVQNNTGSSKTVTAISLGLYGQNVGADVATSGLKIYTNSTPNLSGSPSLQRSANVSGTTFFLTTLTGFSTTLPTGTSYLIFALDINSGATTAHTLFMSASDSPVGLTITGSPVQADTQSDISPIITIGT